MLVIYPLDYKRKGHILDDVSVEYRRYSFFLIIFSLLQLMHDILVIFIYGIFFNYKSLIVFQVKPLPRGCRLTVRSLKSSFRPSILILVLGTLRCKLIGSVILSKKLIHTFFFFLKACHSGSVLGMSSLELIFDSYLNFGSSRLAIRCTPLRGSLLLLLLLLFI